MAWLDTPPLPCLGDDALARKTRETQRVRRAQQQNHWKSAEKWAKIVGKSLENQSVFGHDGTISWQCTSDVHFATSKARFEIFWDWLRAGYDGFHRSLGQQEPTPKTPCAESVVLCVAHFVAVSV